MVYGNPSPMVVRMARMVFTCRSPTAKQEALCLPITWRLLVVVAAVLVLAAAAVRADYLQAQLRCIFQNLILSQLVAVEPGPQQGLPQLEQAVLILSLMPSHLRVVVAVALV
jgi:hypothetical protein